MNRRWFVLLCLIGCFCIAPAVHAATDDLDQAIKDKQDRVKELDDMISGYKQKISSAQNQTADLQNQLELLANQQQEKQLAVERDETEIDSLGLEIKQIENQISSQEDRINKQKDILGNLIRDIQNSDSVSELDVLLAKPSLSEFFAQTEQIKRVQADLETMLQQVRSYKAELETKQRDREAKQKAVQADQDDLHQQQLALEAESNLKASLLTETQDTQSQFQQIVYELNQQQQDASNDISDLETKLKEQLKSTDDALARGDVLFNWPVDPSRGITAIFHDPTYPFANLFQHPGTDIRASVGTAVKAAAGGYVAWHKEGRMYGNYMMLVHPGGFATVYAHLSKFVAKADSYVTRGDVIGMSGGRPGDPGAGLSTGPHLHFEVRQDGVPVDAQNYLPDIPDTDYDYFSDYKKLGIR